MKTIKTYQIEIDSELILDADPKSKLGATTKQYVDNKFKEIYKVLETKKEIPVNTITEKETYNIEEFKYHSIIELKCKIEEQRSKYNPTDIGQILIYQEKLSEAIDFLSNPNDNDLTNYPFLNAELSEIDIEPIQLCKKILNAKTAWTIKMIELEKIKNQYKKLIKNSQSKVDISNILIKAINDIKNI